jgi:hypothetical protein
LWVVERAERSLPVGKAGRAAARDGRYRAVGFNFADGVVASIGYVDNFIRRGGDPRQAAEALCRVYSCCLPLPFSFHLILMLTEFANLSSTIILTSTSPFPIKLRGIGRFTWSSPARPGCAPAYNTSTN